MMCKNRFRLGPGSKRLVVQTTFSQTLTLNSRLDQGLKFGFSNWVEYFLQSSPTRFDGKVMPYQCRFIFFTLWTPTPVQTPWVQNLPLTDCSILQFLWSWTLQSISLSAILCVGCPSQWECDKFVLFEVLKLRQATKKMSRESLRGSLITEWQLRISYY